MDGLSFSFKNVMGKVKALYHSGEPLHINFVVNNPPGLNLRTEHTKSSYNMVLVDRVL